MADRLNIDQATVTTAVIAHLCGQLDIDDNRCRLVIDPMSPGLILGGDWWLTVSYSDGDTDEPMFDGGGDGQLNEVVFMTVAAYTKIKTDPLGSDYNMLLDAQRGLLHVKKRIMRALTNHDVTFGNDGNTFLREFPQPVSATAPRVIRDANNENAVPLGFLAVTFKVSFDWDLSVST